MHAETRKWRLWFLPVGVFLDPEQVYSDTLVDAASLQIIKPSDLFKDVSD